MVPPRGKPGVWVMTMLVLGLILFLGTHSVSIAADPWRNATAARVGETTWKLGYAVLSGVGLWLIIAGYGAARLDPVVLWYPPTWTRHLAATLMLPMFVLLLAAYLPGRIKTAAKHPMLVAVKLWATAHLIANGTLADVLLFGSFLAWAVFDRISLKRRASRPLPVTLTGSARNDAIAVMGGLALYGLFAAWAHLALIGVSPFG